MAAETVDTSPVAARRTRRMARAGWLFAIIALAVAGGIFVLRGRPNPDLPSVPDLAGENETLRAAVRDAEARARTWFGAIDGVAQLGRLYHANGYEDEAVVCWEFLAREQPSDGRWPYYLADLARAAGQVDAMVEHLRDALQRNPEYAPGWLRLAETAFKRANFDEAEAAYRRRLNLVAGDPYARLGLARIALHTGRTEEGKRALATLVRELPDFPSAQNFHAEILARDGDQAGAQRHRALGTGRRFREAEDPWLLELRPHCHQADQLVLWASQEYLTGQPDRARPLFERAIAAAPDRAMAYAEYGRFLLDAGDLEKARDVLARGMQLAPFDPKVCLRLSMALRGLGQFQEALANDRSGLAHDPDGYEFLDSQGRSLAALDRLAEAEQSFRAAWHSSPKAIEPPISLGHMYQKAGRREEARRTLEEALERVPGHPKLQVELGSLALEDNRIDEADRLIRACFRESPWDTRVRALFAQLHLKQATAALARRDASAAERWCTAGLAEVPEAPELLGLLGHLYLQQRKLPEALETMEAHQRLQPGDPRAVMPLVMLYRELNRSAEARRVLTEARDWLKAHGGAEFVAQIEQMLLTLPESQ
jgi:HemY protein